MAHITTEYGHARYAAVHPMWVLRQAERGETARLSSWLYPCYLWLEYGVAIASESKARSTKCVAALSLKQVWHFFSLT